MTALNPYFRFDTMVVGAANRLAVTAARAVAETPGAVYNPLFVYAKPGLGKTHLLMAIGHGAQAIDPALTVEYLTLDHFIEAFHAAIASGQGEAYRKRFADVSLLLVDDVQFLTGQRETQAELLRIVDAMQTASRQIVLTSDRPPSEIEALDERLIRRFAGGLVIDISPPEYETKVAILRRKAEERRVTFEAGVLEAVARLALDNVRELVGALNRLIAHQAAGDAVPPDRVEALLGVGPAADAPETSAAATSPTAAAPAAATPAAQTTTTADEGDEFGEFLSDISATLHQQIEAWRSKVAAAVLRWEGEGYRTARLEALLDGELARDPEEALREFESDVRKLDALRTEAERAAPDLAGSPVFRDPGNVSAAEELLEQAKEGAHPPPAPSPLWRLDAVVEAPGNRVAVQAAQAVAAAPGDKYNPLVLVGGSGVGKTHVLHGIGNALTARGLRVACLSAEEFTGELIEAIDREAITQWRKRYRRADALLLDDVHLVAGKNRSQDELFLLFNHFLENGRQMVFTSAASLSQLEGVESRLLTRLEGGLVAELPAPDREVRQRAADRLLSEKIPEIDPEVAAYIANRPAESVRAVLGLVQRVLSAAETQQAKVTASFARSVLEGPPARPARRPSAPRSSGLVAPGQGGIRSREKMVWDWPDIGDRLIEEWR
ncbi:MAG TPA: DnaA/Hda family protein [Gemmatimonadales bacterium]|nr:DnaA/Hda family protein [Gemmatimonadales bacterium]